MVVSSKKNELVESSVSCRIHIIFMDLGSMCSGEIIFIRYTKFIIKFIEQKIGRVTPTTVMIIFC